MASTSLSVWDWRPGQKACWQTLTKLGRGGPVCTSRRRRGWGWRGVGAGSGAGRREGCVARFCRHFLLRGTGPTSSQRRLLPLSPPLRARPTSRALFPGAEAGLGARRGRAGPGISRRAARAGGPRAGDAGRKAGDGPPAGFLGEGQENNRPGWAGPGGRGEGGGHTLLHPVHFTGNRAHPEEGPGGGPDAANGPAGRGRPARRGPPSLRPWARTPVK